MSYNDYRAYVYNDYNSIYHSGILGMKWGKRRYQNEDGTLTPEGKKRYAAMKKKWMSDSSEFEKHYDDLSDSEREYAKKRMRDIADIKRNEVVEGRKKKSIFKKAAGLAAGAYSLYRGLSNKDFQRNIAATIVHINKLRKRG